MQKPIRTAVLSFWHVHAKDYALQAQQHQGTELAAIWDEQPERGRAEAAARGIRFYEQLDELLADASIDAVIVTAPTVDHPEIMKAAAAAGKHIFTEKVIALTLAECDDILEGVRQANVALTVSLPRLNTPFTQAAQQLARDGLLGELTLVRARLSHSGALPNELEPLGYLPEAFFKQAQSGGGALTDLGCHPMYLVRLFLGMPSSVSASFGYVTGKEVEDNAAVTLRYASGALGLVEAGFVNHASPFTLELHGTKGSLIYSALDGKLMYRSVLLEENGSKRWHEAPLPAAIPTSFEQWVSHIRGGTRAEHNMALARDLTKLIEVSNQSALSGVALQLGDR
ncbi:Gfo/Idh/MocA family oxidoreductase [Paenibacillus algorifonticola]|uniref:Gfo/Idh/MocA family protein n=1 Tax=Paenibacillus algorifonticola TaxID=684063 RepID=UPI003D29277E